jgi:hypothetical protein
MNSIAWTLRTAGWFGLTWIVFLAILLVRIIYSTHRERILTNLLKTRWIKFGGIIRKETSSIIKGPENEEDDEIKTYCPKCCSVMKTWFLKMRKQSKSLTYCNVMIVVKYLLFIIHLPFLELLEFTLESASDYSLPELFI